MMRLQKFSFAILLLTLIFLVSCNTSKKLNSSGNLDSNTANATIDCNALDDLYERALCEIYKSQNFIINSIDLAEEADLLESKYFLYDKIAAKKTSDRIKLTYGEDFIGEEISMLNAFNLAGNAHAHRSTVHNLEVIESEIVPGYRYDEPHAYDLERSVYYSWPDIDIWINAVSEAYGVERSNIGVRVYFGEYEESDNEDEDRRSTVILRAMKLIEGELYRIEDNPELTTRVVYNLGGLCPPDCTFSSNNDAPINVNTIEGGNVKPK